jgi:hypothetical protein
MHEARTHQRSLDGKVREQDLFRALPLLRRRRNLVRLELPFTEVRDGVDDDPGDAAAEVDSLKSGQTFSEGLYRHASTLTS